MLTARIQELLSIWPWSTIYSATMPKNTDVKEPAGLARVWFFYVGVLGFGVFGDFTVGPQRRDHRHRWVTGCSGVPKIMTWASCEVGRSRASPCVATMGLRPPRDDLAAHEVQHLNHLVPRSSSRVELLLQLPQRVLAAPFSTGLAWSSVDGLRRQGTQGRR